MAAVEEARARNAGKREMNDLMNHLHWMIENMPSNMAFAADQLTEHAENVVTRSRADIEAMMASFRNLSTISPALVSHVIELDAVTEDEDDAALLDEWDVTLRRNSNTLPR